MPGSRRRIALATGVVVATTTALVLDLVVAPPDADQGQVQRLMYVHVPAAWTGYLCFALVAVASIGYLVRRDLRWDRWAQAGAELGIGMTALAIVLGSIWGHLTWGVWWTWDARLVTTTVLLLVYLGYVGVRGLGGGAHLAARRAAVVGVIGFADVPVVHFSVVWWRTLHQPPTLLGPSTSPPMDPTMLVALLVSTVAFTLAAAWVVVRRVDVLASTAPLDDVPLTIPDEVPTLVVVGRPR